MIRRETFVSCLTSLLAEADAALLSEAEGLVFWRKRELRALRVAEYSAGQFIRYLAKDGQTELNGRIDHLNRYSVSVKRDHPTEGYSIEVVAIERVLGLGMRPY
jgi:hypothetical protein